MESRSCRVRREWAPCAQGITRRKRELDVVLRDRGSPRPRPGRSTRRVALSPAARALSCVDARGGRGADSRRARDRSRRAKCVSSAGREGSARRRGGRRPVARSGIRGSARLQRQTAGRRARRAVARSSRASGEQRALRAQAFVAGRSSDHDRRSRAGRRCAPPRRSGQPRSRAPAPAARRGPRGVRRKPVLRARDRADRCSERVSRRRPASLCPCPNRCTSSSTDGFSRCRRRAASICLQLLHTRNRRREVVEAAAGVDRSDGLATRARRGNRRARR